MKISIQTPNIIRGIAIAAFFASSYLGAFATTKIEGLLDELFISVDFIWLALVIILTFSLSVFILYKIYLKYGLLIGKESKDTLSTTKDFIAFVGLGLLMGFVFPFALRSFFMIILWVFSNL